MSVIMRHECSSPYRVLTGLCRLSYAFEGELALPSALAVNLRLEDAAVLAGFITLDGDEELRPTEVLLMEGNPLLGLLDGSHIHIEATNGGEIVIEPL